MDWRRWRAPPTLSSARRAAAVGRVPGARARTGRGPPRLLLGYLLHVHQNTSALIMPDLAQLAQLLLHVVTHNYPVDYHVR